MSPKPKGKKKSKSPEAETIPPPPSRKKLMKRFYEPLVLKHVLDPTCGNHIQCEMLDASDNSELDNRKLRRAFLNSLAYICDFKRGGTTVTAVALEMRPEGVVFWVAANGSIKDKVTLFLEGVLQSLEGVTEEHAAKVEETIFRDAVKFGMPRVTAYWNFLQKSLNKSLKVLEDEQSQGMMEWLSFLKDRKEESMLHLCRFAYDARTSPFMKELTQRSEKGSGQVCIQESNATNFLEVRHYIGRLGSHKKAAKTLVATAMRFPGLFDDFEVKYLSSPKPAERPQVDNQTTLDGIAVRMLPKDDPRLTSCQNDLRDMDRKFNIRARLMEEYDKPTFLPRVHAELILLEHFHTQQCDFVDNDKYIGCSKPACYCCYHYICAHPGNFVRPASHNKIYLNWRPPDIINDDAEGPIATHQRDIMNKVIVEIRKDVLIQIREQSGRRNAHPDSTTGITLTAL